MSDKFNLSDITKYINSLIDFNQIKTPKANHPGSGASCKLIVIHAEWTNVQSWIGKNFNVVFLYYNFPYITIFEAVLYVTLYNLIQLHLI